MALALPSVTEQDHFGGASFHVDKKIFAQLSADEQTGLVKLSIGLQEWAISTFPDSCTIELNWGRYGWTRLSWRNISTDVLSDFLLQSWKAVAPRKMHILLPS